MHPSILDQKFRQSPAKPANTKMYPTHFSSCTESKKAHQKKSSSFGTEESEVLVHVIQWKCGNTAALSTNNLFRYLKTTTTTTKVEQQYTNIQTKNLVFGLEALLVLLQSLQCLAPWSKKVDQSLMHNSAFCFIYLPLKRGTGQLLSHGLSKQAWLPGPSTDLVLSSSSQSFFSLLCDIIKLMHACSTSSPPQTILLVLVDVNSRTTRNWCLFFISLPYH